MTDLTNLAFFKTNVTLIWQYGLHLMGSVLLLATIAWWQVSPPHRDQWVWLVLPLSLSITIHYITFFFTKSIIFRTKVLYFGLFIGYFLLMSLFYWNFENAPLHRNDFWVLVCRPLLGVALLIFCVGYVQIYRDTNALWRVTLAGIFVLAFFALTSTQWHAKSDSLSYITELLPVFNFREWLPSFNLSFNPNEIAGAIVYLIPPSLALAVSSEPKWGRVARLLAFLGFSLLVIALILGQSRFGIAGAFVGVFLVVTFAVSNRMRWIAWGILVAYFIFQVLLMRAVPQNASTNDLPIITTLSERDQNSLSTRFAMWQRGLEMLSHSPLTGVGMTMYRQAIRQPRYQIPYFEEINFTAPHAHNEWVQIATDLGIFGLILFASLHIGAWWATWQVWKQGTPSQKSLVLGAWAGWIAHSIYGLGDAITLFDRFGFMGWWILGLIFACYAQSANTHIMIKDENNSSSTIE